jgi:hypothetical protein
MTDWLNFKKKKKKKSKENNQIFKYDANIKFTLFKHIIFFSKKLNDFRKIKNKF